MINCEEAALLISKRLQRRLSLRRDWALRLHVLMCAACRRYAAQLRWLHEHLHNEARAELPVGLDATARERIVERLHVAQVDSGERA